MLFKILHNLTQQLRISIDILRLTTFSVNIMLKILHFKTHVMSTLYRTPYCLKTHTTKYGRIILVPI